MAEHFLFDDFFVAADDPGADVAVMINGRNVPLKIKRGLTLQDIEASKAAAIKTKINAQGAPELLSVDENEFTLQVLERTVLSWPFTMADGSPVPINRANLEAMMMQGSQALQQLVLNMVQNRPDQTPFVQPSAEA